MVCEIFIFYLVGHIFVFTVANLAMTFSGNKISQLVSTVLIIFLIPFLILTSRLYYEEKNGIDASSEDTINITEIYHFTLPSYGIDVLMNGEDFKYDGEAVIKTLIMNISIKQLSFN